MSTYFKTDAFHLKRYKDNHGKWYTVHVNRRPRGKVWMQLYRLEWSASSVRLQRLAEKCEQYLKEAGL
jgi:hypothetical protein